jgi:hypothetical protein
MQRDPGGKKLQAVLVWKEGGKEIPVFVCDPPPAVFTFTRHTDSNQIFVRQENTSDPVIYIEGDRRRDRRFALGGGDRRKVAP